MSKECCGIFGKIFGHKYEKVFNENYTLNPVNNKFSKIDGYGWNVIFESLKDRKT